MKRPSMEMEFLQRHGYEKQIDAAMALQQAGYFSTAQLQSVQGYVHDAVHEGKRHMTAEFLRGILEITGYDLDAIMIFGPKLKSSFHNSRWDVLEKNGFYSEREVVDAIMDTRRYPGMSDATLYGYFSRVMRSQKPAPKRMRSVLTHLCNEDPKVEEAFINPPRSMLEVIVTEAITKRLSNGQLTNDDIYRLCAAIEGALKEEKKELREAGEAACAYTA